MQRRDLLKSALGSLAACAGNTTMLGGWGSLTARRRWVVPHSTIISPW